MRQPSWRDVSGWSSCRRLLPCCVRLRQLGGQSCECVCVRDEMIQISETDLLCGARTRQGGKPRAEEMG